MTDLNKTIEYVFKLKDNIAQAAGQMAQELDRANEAVHIHEQNQDSMVVHVEETLDRVDAATDRVSAAQKELRHEMDATSAKAQAQQTDLLTLHEQNQDSMVVHVEEALHRVDVATDRTSASQQELRAEMDATSAKVGEVVQIHEQAQDSMATHMEETLGRVDAATDRASVAQQELRQEMDTTSAKAQAQQVDLLTQLTSIMALKEGVAAVTGGVVALGLVGEDTAQTLMKVNAGFQLMAGTVQTLKAVQGVMTTLNLANAIGATIDTYRAALQSPLALGAVGLAAGAAVGVAGALLMTNNQTTNNSTTTITVQDTTPHQAVSQIYQVVEGGAL